MDEGPETNVAEIRSLVLENEPGGDETDLSDEIRAKSLQGIVVSDKGGGTSSPSSSISPMTRRRAEQA